MQLLIYLLIALFFLLLIVSVYKAIGSIRRNPLAKKAILTSAAIQVSLTLAGTTALIFLVNSPVKDVDINKMLYPPCSQPITYSLGPIDPKFTLTGLQLQNLAEQSEDFWEIPLKKNLFSLQLNGEFTVNLTFQAKNQMSIQAQVNQDKLQELDTQFKLKEEEYQKMKDNFKRHQEDITEKISYWKTNGGITPQNQDYLDQEQKKLKTEQEQLDELAQQLNKQLDEYNLAVNNFNQTAIDLNTNAQNNPTQKQPTSSQNTIEIYSSGNTTELVSKIASAFAIILGLDAQDTKLTDAAIQKLKSLCKDSDNWWTLPNLKDRFRVKI